MTEKIYIWNKIGWSYYENPFGDSCDSVTARCPRCKCVLCKSKEKYERGEYKYCCVNCDFKITFEKTIEEKISDFVNVMESRRFKDAEIINIDGELIKIRRDEQTDFDYWIDVKLSKNRKDEIQLMVLAGSKKDKDKTQLFLEPKNEKLTFDQNNDHPSQVFTKVIATFKNSKSKIASQKK